MKKYFFISLLIIGAFFLYKNNFKADSDFRIEWEYTNVNIPLFTNDVEKYLKMPNAKLYYKNKLIKNPIVEKKYSYGNIHIPSSKLGDYVLTIEINFIEYELTYFNTISFHVVDMDHPTVTNIKNLEIEVKKGKVDLKTYFLVSDNYYDLNDIFVEYKNIDKVNFEKIGIYPIVIHVKDKSGNEKSYFYDIKIVDTTKPNLIIKKPFIHKITNDFLIENYIEIKDNYDLNIDYIFEDGKINFYKEGKYPFVIKAYDSSNNKLEYNGIFQIIDDRKPEVIVTDERIITVKDNSYLEILSSFVDKIVYKGKTYLKEDIFINTFNFNINKIGTYNVSYEIKEEDIVIFKKDIEVKVVDNIKPEINLKNELLFLVNNNYDLENYFIISDNYDDISNLKLEILNKIDFTKIGNFSLKVKLTDSSKNILYKTFDCLIYDNIKPTYETNIFEIKINLYDKIDFNMFKFSDNYDKKITNINYSIENKYNETIGNKNLNIKAYDNSNNLLEINIKVVVLDNINPIINLKENQIFINLNNNYNIDLNSLISSVTDNYDELKISDIKIIENTLDTTKIGKYHLLLSLSDKQNNTAYEKIFFVVDDNIKPIVESSDLILKNLNNFDPLEGIKVTEDSKYTISYEFSENFSNNLKSGYEGYITYHIFDERGNLTIHNRKVIYEKNNNLNIFLIIIGFILGFGIIDISFIFIYKYYKKIKK